MRPGLLGGLLFAACQSAVPKAEQALVSLVDDEDRGVRYAAVMALGKAGAGEAALARALRDPEWCVRAEAAVALARVGPRALPLVLEAARHPDREVRLEAWTALRKMGPTALRAGHAALRAGLASADAEERLEAARCLVLLGPEEHDALLPVVLAALENEEDPDLRCRAAWIVRTVGPSAAAAAPTLDMLLADGKWRHSDALRGALAAVRPESRPDESPRAFLMEQEAWEWLSSADTREVLEGAIALERRGLDPRPPLAARDESGAARVFVTLGPGPPLPPDRWLSADDAVLRESAAIALGQRGIAAKLLGDPDPRVRAAAVWSHGRADIPLPDAMRDDDPVVREMAVRTLGQRELAAALLEDDVAVRRLAASRCAGERIFVAELVPAAGAHDHDLRILATRALSRCGQPFLPALDDASRAVRLEAVLGLSAQHEEHLLRALEDPDWRIRRAALRRLGSSAAAAARFLGDPNPLLAEAAADALSRMGPDAALPLARLLPGNEAVRYHAPRVFAALGPDGAAAVPALVPLLRDADVNVRECAARCLTGIGPGARAARDVLVEALADPRLCVVSHAALALGRIGVTPELARALRDRRARVRAYAAFAYGWARGDERGLDQVPFEVRLPVLDCGDAPPGRFMELRSKDPAVAVPCAAARKAEELDAWECERVMELLLCGGCRPGAPGKFDRFRDILGSAELPAQMQYLARARRTGYGKAGVFGQNHRIARHENVPAILWFVRTEDDDSLNGVSELYQPVHATDDVSLFVPEERDRRGPGIPPALRALLEGAEDPWGIAPWWLNGVAPLEGDAPLLLDLARRAFGPDGDPYARAAAVRALGTVHDAESERFLRDVAWRSWSKDEQALDTLAGAALARRGHPDALADLEELDLLLEAAPGFAVARLRARLLDRGGSEAACEELDDALENLTFHGVQLDETLFAGIAEAAIESDLDGLALARIGVTVPGCRRADLADAALGRLDPEAWRPDEETWRLPLEPAAFLHSADPERFVAVLREWSEHEDEPVRWAVLRMLLQIGDPASAEKLVGAVADSDDYELLARTRAPAVERFLVEQAKAGTSGARDGLFAYNRGIPSWIVPEDTPVDEPVPRLLARTEKVVHPELGLLNDPRVVDWLERKRRDRTFTYWETLGALVLAGDRDARQELWSMIRCGRHRLLYGGFREERVFTLDWDFSTLPHWIEELDSNCCRVAGGLESVFEDHLGGSRLYHRPSLGFGEPRSRRARKELLWSGGSWVWSPLVDHFVARPD